MWSASAAGARRDEIGQRHVGAPFAPGELLAQRVQHGDRLGSPLVAVDEDVVALGIRRPEAEHGAGAEPALRRDAVEHRLRVREQAARRLAVFGVVEDRGKLAGELPGGEERRPVDVVAQLRDRIVLEHPRSEERRRLRDVIARPVELQRIGARILERQPLLGLLAARMRGGDAGIFLADVGHVGRARLRRHQARRHADGAAGVGDIDRLPAPVVRMDLHRRVHAAGGGAADQQRQVEALPLHLGGDVAHLVERRRDQAGEPDDVGVLLLRRLQDLRRRHHHAEIDHLVIVALEHDADDVLADVVHVALDRGHDDLAVGARSSRCPCPSSPAP